MVFDGPLGRTKAEQFADGYVKAWNRAREIGLPQGPDRLYVVPMLVEMELGGAWVATAEEGSDG
jgi:hypothetical protein